MFQTVGLKLFVLVFCAILTGVLALGWCSHSRSKRAIETEAAEAGRITARRRAARRTSDAAGTIAASNEEIASGEAGLAFASGQGAGPADEIGAKVRNVVASNEEMKRAAAETEEAGAGGAGRMEALIGNTHRMEAMIRAMAGAMADVSSIAQQAAAASGDAANLGRKQLGVSEGLENLPNRLKSVSDQPRASPSRFTVA